MTEIDSLKQTNSVENKSQQLANLIVQSKASEHAELLPLAKLSLIDYLAAVLGGCKTTAVQKVIQTLALPVQKLPVFGAEINQNFECSAFVNGFAGHYLDIDDTHADLRGHPSAVIDGALFAVSTGKETLNQFLWATVIGIEVAAQFGTILNPKLAQKGIHTTGAIGAISAAAAIAVYKKLTCAQTQQLLSIAATQAFALEIQAGSDTKPLNAGFAARNAVSAWQWCQAGLSANEDVFSGARGWFRVIGDVDFELHKIAQQWLRPGKIKAPGMWYKSQPFCSAAMAGYDAARILYQRGFSLENCLEISLNFPKNGDRPLRFTAPRTGQEGKFSIEYIVWQVLKYGKPTKTAFDNQPVPAEFKHALSKFKRHHSLIAKDWHDRPIEITITTQTNAVISVRVDQPKGAPKNALNLDEVIEKLQIQVMTDSRYLKQTLQNPKLTMEALIQIVRSA
ncbi:MmgE/PrpD family protein [Agrilactobacillus yilanensis]|uniref:MmgE/PrpD family protein n=1 Tax=Agrilactobacillus yilanensis TaxID=2485997 RepID=A0ABW4J5U8_9LACO|nr:MmgE/PrpD family protein [Agrilactobacillus yilanensis]